MKEININEWERKSHYEFFSRMDYPHFNICFDISITGFLAYTKAKDLSFYYSMIYLATLSANQIEAFRYRKRNDKIVLHEKIHPSFTDMNRGEELFRIVTVPFEENLENFVLNAKEKSISQKEYFIQNDFSGRDDFIYITSIPWISFTHISHTISPDRNDSVPRISWGRYYNSGKEVMLPFSVQVNHCFADGIHVGKYKDILELNMKKFCEL